MLDGVDLEVPAGTSVALVGQTGCGKSTLMRLLPRFIEPLDGHVTIDGQDVSSVTLTSLRTEIGIVFEDTLLFSDTVAANIAFGRPDATEEEIVRAAAIAQAHEFIEELPEGYDTPVGEHGYTLSGGQRQRVAIARAILMNPSILILDDATSNVDARVEAAIRKGLRSAMQGRTTIIVARRPQTAALADRVALHGRRAHHRRRHARPRCGATTRTYRETLLATVDVDAVAGEAGLEVEIHEEESGLSKARDARGRLMMRGPLGRAIGDTDPRRRGRGQASASASFACSGRTSSRTSGSRSAARRCCIVASSGSARHAVS